MVVIAYSIPFTFQMMHNTNIIPIFPLIKNIKYK
jgi:hypothetical protein